MMGIQLHPPCWEIHIVVIPCHLAKSLQATNSSFVFNLIIGALELDSNWNIMQQVRIHKKVDSYALLRATKNNMRIEEMFLGY